MGKKANLEGLPDPETSLELAEDLPEVYSVQARFGEELMFAMVSHLSPYDEDYIEGWDDDVYGDYLDEDEDVGYGDEDTDDEDNWEDEDNIYMRAIREIAGRW